MPFTATDENSSSPNYSVASLSATNSMYTVINQAFDAPNADNMYGDINSAGHNTIANAVYGDINAAGHDTIANAVYGVLVEEEIVGGSGVQTNAGFGGVELHCVEDSSICDLLFLFFFYFFFGPF